MNSTEINENESEVKIIRNKEENLIKGIDLMEKIHWNLMKLRETVKKPKEKPKETNNALTKKDPKKFEKLAEYLEMFCLVFFMIANAVPAILLVVVGGT